MHTIDDWDKNSKYILTAIESLCENQKELSHKFDIIQDQISVQKDECNKRFVSKWVFGILVTVLLSVFTLYGLNTKDIYHKLDHNTAQIVRHNDKIEDNKNKLDKFIADFDEIKKSMDLEKYRRTVKTEKGSEIFWYVKKRKDGDEPYDIVIP